MASSFDEQVVLITGGNSGIGLACVKKFHHLGAKVIATGRRPLSALTDLSSTESTLLQQIDYQVCDVAQPEDIAALFQYINTQYGKLDIAINNAGIAGPHHKTLTELTLDDYDLVMNINARGVLLCLQNEIAIMLKHKKGSIINISSVAGLRGSQVSPLYGMSKFAVNGLTRCAALEYATQGIRINALCPALIDTPMTTRDLGEELSQKFTKIIPLGRPGTPEEVANFAAWLSSDDASFVTGATYTVDGGVMA